MKIYHTALFVLSSLFVQCGKGVSDTLENQSSGGAGFGLAELSAGGMLAMIVLGIFGAVLFVIICCASWSMIITCCQLRASNAKNGESFREQRQFVVYHEKSYLSSSLFQHSLANEGPVNSTESVV